MSKKERSNEHSKIKKSLETLGYNEPLGEDSVLLANRLLSVVGCSTDALKKLQEEKEKLSLELKNQGNLILPLRNENLRITKENNDLHNQMIQLEDNLDKFKSINNEYNKKVEKESDDFKILINQKEYQIKKQQNEIDTLKKKLLNYWTK
jgi:ABC-type antimicrobial peptide transport system permease subunit